MSSWRAHSAATAWLSSSFAHLYCSSELIEAKEAIFNGPHVPELLLENADGHPVGQSISKGRPVLRPPEVLRVVVVVLAQRASGSHGQLSQLVSLQEFEHLLHPPDHQGLEAALPAA